MTTTNQGAEETAQPAGEGGWFNCEVTMAGPGEDGSIYIHLRELNGAFDRWYTAVEAVRKEMLATALTAMSADRHVRAKLTTTDAYGVINRLFVR